MLRISYFLNSASCVLGSRQIYINMTFVKVNQRRHIGLCVRVCMFVSVPDFLVLLWHKYCQFVID